MSLHKRNKTLMYSVQLLWPYTRTSVRRKCHHHAVIDWAHKTNVERVQILTRLCDKVPTWSCTSLFIITHLWIYPSIHPPFRLLIYYVSTCIHLCFYASLYRVTLSSRSLSYDRSIASSFCSLSYDRSIASSFCRLSYDRFVSIDINQLVSLVVDTNSSIVEWRVAIINYSNLCVLTH
jgi:hypothetical protein